MPIVNISLPSWYLEQAGAFFEVEVRLKDSEEVQIAQIASARERQPNRRQGAKTSRVSLCHRVPASMVPPRFPHPLVAPRPLCLVVDPPLLGQARPPTSLFYSLT